MANAKDLLEADARRTASARAAASSRSLSQETYRLTDARLADVLGTATSSGATVTELSALSVPTFSACAGLLSDMLGMLPCKLYQKTPAGREEVEDHPAHRLVSRDPSESLTAYQLRKLAQDGVSYGGNGYIRVWRNQFYEPEEIGWLRPCDVTPVAYKTNDGRLRVKYKVNGERKELTRADVVHVFGMSLDGVSGISNLRLLRESLGTQISQRTQAATIFKNGARFPGFLKAPVGLTKEQMDDARADWAAKQEGSANSGRTPILRGEWQYAAINGMSLEDAEFLDSRKFERSEVATMFRIPEVLLGNSDKASSWGTGIETLTNGFLAFSLNPWLVNWESALRVTLLTEEEKARGYYFRFNRGALLQVALEAQAKFFREMRDIGVFSVNDVRRRLEENDLPDGIGDNYRLPFNGSGGATAQASAQPSEVQQ